MRWITIIVLYFLGMFVTLDHYQDVYERRYGQLPEWYRSLSIGVLWPISSFVIYSVNWEPIKEK